MNKLIIALLLLLPMIVHAQVSGPGNTFGGGGGGSGATTNSSGVVHPTITPDDTDFAIGGTDSTAQFFFDSSEGVLTINEPGGGITVLPSPTLGSGIVLSEAGNHSGSETFTLKVADSANLSSDLTCSIDASGVWTGACPTGSSSTRNITWGLLPTTVLSSDAFIEIVDSNAIGTGATDVTVTTVSGTIQTGENFTFNTAGVYEITYGFQIGQFAYTGGDTFGCFALSFFSLARGGGAAEIAWTNVSTSVGAWTFTVPSSSVGGIKSVTWVGNIAAGEDWGLYYDQCQSARGRLNFNPHTTNTWNNFYKIERLN